MLGLIQAIIYEFKITTWQKQSQVFIALKVAFNKRLTITNMAHQQMRHEARSRQAD